MKECCLKDRADGLFSLRRMLCSIAPGVLLAFFFVYGKYLMEKETLVGAVQATWLPWLGLSVLYACLLFILYVLLERNSERAFSQVHAAWGWKVFAVVWAILFLCWHPVLLASWPGFFANDVTDQWQQVVTGVWNGHSPVLHTALMGGIVEGLHALTGDYNLAVAGYTIVQMLVMSCIFAYAILFLYRQSGYCKWLAVLALCYYGLFPVCSMFSVCATKDSLFSSMLLMELLCIIELIREPERFFRSGWRIARFCVISFLTLAMRNNIFAAFLLFTPFLIGQMKAYRKKTAVLMAVILAVMGLYYGPLFSALQIKRGGKPDILSVPLQQISRVYTVSNDTFTEAEWAVLFEVLPEDVMEDYEPMLADQVKGRFHATEFGANLARYGKIYLTGLMRAPRVYLEAFMLNNLYAWYPDSTIDGYVRAGTHPYEEAETCYFEPVADEPAHMESKLPGLLAFYETISTKRSIQNIPVVKWLFSIGAMLWLVVITFFYGVWRRRKDVYLPLWMVLLTCLVTFFNPIVLVRYYLILFFSFPLLLTKLFQRNEQKKAQRDAPCFLGES